MPKADVKPLETGPGWGWGNPKLDKVPGICYTIPVGQTDMMGALVFTINPGQFAPCEWSQSLPPFVRQQGQLTGGFVMSKKRDRSGRDRSNEKDVACLDCGTNIYRGSTRCKSCANKQRWETGVYGSDEYCAKLSERKTQDWDNGVYDREAWSEIARRRAEEMWADGTFGSDKWKAKQRAAKQALWASGHYDHIVELQRTPEARAKTSAMFKRLWREGCFDERTYPATTSIEIELSVALDIMGIAHTPQYRPKGCTYVFDEFVPPNIMIEANGDYWHNLPGRPERDAYRARWAKGHGYQLIVFWEHEIKETGAWALIHSRILPLLEQANAKG